MSDARRFWAFISYSHEDRAWARWLHRAIETYRIPSSVVGAPTPNGPVPRRLRPVFKDREDLAASPDLRAEVSAALENSGALVVLCSPAAVASVWVDEEIRRFREAHGAARVFAVIVAGAPNAADPARECFPAELRASLGRADLVAADLRPHADGRRLAKLKLIAGILGVALDDLVRRDAQRRGRQLITVTLAALAGSLVMAALAVTAVIARNEARAQRAQAEGLVAFMLGDLRKKLEPTGRLDLLDAVAWRTMSYYGAQRPHGLDDAALGQRARALHLLGELAERRGRLDAAQASFAQAAATTAELFRRSPNDGDRAFNHAQSLYYLGKVARRRGAAEAARRWYLAYLIMADRLTALDPERDDWRQEVADAHADLGGLALDAGRADQARLEFEQALRIGARLAARGPTDRDRQSDLGQYYAGLADALAATDRISAAEAQRVAEMRIYSRLLDAQPGDSDAANALIVAKTAIARLELRELKPRKALAVLSSAAADGRRLCATMREDQGCEEDQILLLATEARAYMQIGDADRALESAREASLAAEHLKKGELWTLPWSDYVAGSARLALLQVLFVRAKSAVERRRIAGLAASEAAVCAALAMKAPMDAHLRQLARDAADLAGHESVKRRPNQ